MKKCNSKGSISYFCNPFWLRTRDINWYAVGMIQENSVNDKVNGSGIAFNVYDLVQMNDKFAQIIINI